MKNKYYHIFFLFLTILINPKVSHAVDLSSSTPSDNATQIVVNTSITLEWAGSVTVADGNVILKKKTDECIEKTILENPI